MCAGSRHRPNIFCLSVPNVSTLVCLFCTTQRTRQSRLMFIITHKQQLAHQTATMLRRVMSNRRVVSSQPPVSSQRVQKGIEKCKKRWSRDPLATLNLGSTGLLQLRQSNVDNVGFLTGPVHSAFFCTIVLATVANRQAQAVSRRAQPHKWCSAQALCCRIYYSACQKVNDRRDFTAALPVLACSI